MGLILSMFYTFGIKFSHSHLQREREKEGGGKREKDRMRQETVPREATAWTERGKRKDAVCLLDK